MITTLATLPPAMQYRAEQGTRSFCLANQSLDVCGDLRLLRPAAAGCNMQPCGAGLRAGYYEGWWRGFTPLVVLATRCVYAAWLRFVGVRAYCDDGDNGG